MWFVWCREQLATDIWSELEDNYGKVQLCEVTVMGAWRGTTLVCVLGAASAAV